MFKVPESERIRQTDRQTSGNTMYKERRDREQHKHPEKFHGALYFQGVAFIRVRVRKEELGLVGQEGKGLSEDSGIKKFSNLQIKHRSD